MSVQKAVELIGTGTTIQDAVTEALDRARLTLDGITSFEVADITGVVDGASVEYRVELRVWFTLLERMHGSTGSRAWSCRSGSTPSKASTATCWPTATA